MKNNKSLFRILATLMSLALALVVIVALGALSVGATSVDTTEEQERETIPVPEVPAIDRPYKTIEELGIDYEKIDAYFPQNIEIRYEGGKVYVEDFGVSSVETYDANGYGYVYLELIDGYWTAELSAAPTVLYVYSYETSINDRYLNANYYGDGHRDQYIRLYDSVIGVDVSFAFKYGTVTVLYQSGNYCYEDRYEDGVLDTHGVSNYEDEENTNQVLYEIDGKIRYCTLYIDGYYHYFPEQGWSSNWEKFVTCDAPAGYETVDETYFTANKPSLICAEAKGDDIVHDMSTAYCTTPSTCKNGCGYTIGEIDYHDWQMVDGKKECLNCDAVFFPDFEFIDRAYNNLEEPGFPYDEIKAVFPKELTVKYEDGMYMVKDVGADKAKAYNDVDYENIELSLVDGWWICELDEEIYNDESIKIFVYFEGEIDGIYWNITYTNGTVNSDLYLMSMSDDLGVLVYYDDYDRVVSMYYVGDRLYNDEYKNGALASQEGSIYVGEDHVYIEYLADGSWERVRIYIGKDWYYYYPDGVWEKGVEVLLTPPAGFENADVAYFESIIPTTINCAHENYSEADCENPERCLICGIVKDGSEPLGHDWIDATCVSPKHCELCGATEGEIDENAHRSDGGENCADCGEHAFVTINGETYAILGDITNTGIYFNHNESPAPGAFKAGDGYLVLIVKDSYYADVILYNATVDVREIEDVVAVDIIKDHLDYYVYGTNNIYGNNRRAFHNGTVGEDTITNFIIDEDAVLNIYGDSDFDHLVVTSGEMNVYGRDISGDVGMAMQVIKSLTVKEGATLTAVGGKSDMGITVGIWVRKETVVDGVLNAFTVNREETEEKAILTFIVNGDVTLNCDNFNVYADYPGYEIILSVPEGASLTVPEGIKLDLDSYTGVEIGGELIVNGTLICTHEGGEANCTTLAVCDICKQSYGELDSDNHDMAEADCTTPKTCKRGCGHTEGEALGHDMADADCTTPATCKICGHTEGEALGHDMAEATCTDPATCKRGCGHTEGEALGHDWIDATYDSPKTCSVCGETEGEPLSKDTENEETESESANVGSDDEEDEETRRPSKKPQQSVAQTDAPEGEDPLYAILGGCGSNIGIGFGALALVAVVYAVIIFKKEKEEG